MSYQLWNIVLGDSDKIFIHWYDTLASTNTTALKLAQSGAPEWTVIAAAGQTAGRGRFQRQWVSPAGSGLWFSVILRPAIESQFLNLLTLHAALVVHDFLSQLLQENSSTFQHLLQVKWPNDILLNKKKIAGLLFESAIVSQKVEYMVAGIGINILQSRNDFPPELRKSAISLNMVVAKKWDIKELLVRFLKFYHQEYQKALTAKFREVVNHYQQHLLFLNQKVLIHFPEQEISGILKGVNQYGHLLVESAGKLKEISSSDIWMIKEEDDR